MAARWQRDIDGFRHGTLRAGLLLERARCVALIAGGVVSVLSAVVGVFTVIRGQSFAGHAFGDIGTTGGSAAFLAGVTPLWGFVGVGMAAAVTMELLGVQRARGRDVATGVVLGAALGVSALLLYWDTTFKSTTGETVTILFGSLFTVSGATVPAMVGISLAALAGVILLYRPMLLSSISAEMAGCAASAGASRRCRLSRHHGARRLPVRRDRRGDPLDGTVDRSGGDGSPDNETSPRRHARICRDRAGRHMGRNPALVRQLLLAAGQARLARQLSRGGAHLHLLLGADLAGSIRPPAEA